MTHLPIALILSGFGLVLFRPEWTSVATLVVFSVLAVLYSAREVMGNGLADVRRMLAELRVRDDERAAALARLSSAQDKHAAELKQTEERLSRLGAPAQKARL